TARLAALAALFVVQASRLRGRRDACTKRTYSRTAPRGRRMVANIAPVTVKLLVTLKSPQDADRVRATGAKVLAEYPDTLLVRATATERQHLQAEHLEHVELQHPPVQIAGVSFAFPSALAAEQAAPSPPTLPHRTAYYLVRLIGPVKGE